MLLYGEFLRRPGTSSLLIMEYLLLRPSDSNRLIGLLPQQHHNYYSEVSATVAYLGAV